MTDTGSGRPIYMRDVAEPVFGFFHAPSTSSAAGRGVVICPPFGWDEICSYRSRREWARELAQAGHAVIRMDLPGSGDSGGAPQDPGQLSSWTAAVGSAARRLRELAGVDHVTAIGIGLGGLVLCNAIAQGAPVEEVVLWAVPARGRALVRELRVFASLEHSPLGAVADRELGPPPLPDGYVWAGGFLLTAQTVRQLEELDLSTLPIPDGRIERALMLDRDGLSVDERLRAHLERSGARVSVAPGRGYGAMMAQPHEAVPPYGVFNRVFSWLREEDASEPARGSAAGPAGIADAEPGGGPAGGIPAGPAGIAGAEPGGGPAGGIPAGPAGIAGAEPGGGHGGGYSVRASAPSAGETIELGVDGVSIRETPMTVAWPTGDLFGILAEPVDVPPAALSVVLLNAGAIRRIGPNRMWVEAARRWAAQGVHSLRLDLEGIGDAEGDPHRLTELAALYTPELVDQVCAALDELEHRGMGHRFVLAGLCSGAYWSFHAALRDERVAAAFMLNPQALFWDESLEASRALRRGVLRSSSWRKLVRGQVPLERMRDLAYRAPVALPRRALARRSARRRGENELEDAFDRLRDAGKPLRFIFSGNEPLCEELELEGYLARLDRWPNASVEFIPGQIHTLRPLQSQQGAHQALDRALAGMLEEAELKTSPASGA